VEEIMNSFMKLSWVGTKIFFREYISSFFVLVFPVLMLLIFGAMYGNQPAQVFNGRGAMDVSIPGYIVALVIGTAGFISLPIDLATYRERGILRRYRATPLRPGWVLGSQLVVTFLATLLGTLILIGCGILIYHLRLPEAMLLTLLGFVIACLSSFATGFLIASLAPTASAARAIGMVVYYPMMFLSGGTLPREFMPETLKRIANFFPMTYALDLFKGLWFGQGWNLTALAILAGVVVVCVLVAVRFFRWE
jgi:ABC-2 type transport system permease protein